MRSRLSRALSVLDLEERILTASTLVAFVGVFLPWLSGEWLGGERMNFSGLGFYTSFLGFAVMLMNLAPLLLTLTEVLGGPALLRKRLKAPLLFFLALQSTILVLASLSVLTKVTFEFSRMEVRFGIYISLIGSLVSVLYSFLIYQQSHKEPHQEVFQHPEDRTAPPERREPSIAVPPPPPPPAPPEPEEHNLRP